MTSAISTPFHFVARIPGPISTKDVELAVANAPKDLEITVEEIVRDLDQIVSTNAFGDKTPKLTDDLKAEIAKLAPAEEPGAMNNTAAAFAEYLTPPPAPGRIFAEAHTLQAAVTGAVVAMEAQLASSTPEQKADKQTLIDAYKTNIVDYKMLTMFNTLWAAFAKPAGSGIFELPRNIVGQMAESIAAGEIVGELKKTLLAKLAPSEASKTATPLDPQKLAEVAQREMTRPIAGKTDEQLETIYKKVTTEAKTQRIVHRPERFRTEKYQKLLDLLYANPQAEIIVPMLRELIGRFNVESRRQQKANHTEISATFDDGDTQLRAMREVALRVADRIGAGDPTVTRVANSAMNAWVSSVDLDNPHITYYSHLQEMVWDDAKGDWLKFHVDAKDNFCEADAPGAREISGDKLVEVVFAHELTHISEEAVLNQYLLAIMLGVNLKESAALHGDGCVCSGCATIVEKVELATAIMDDPRLQKLLTTPDFKQAQLKLADQLGLKDVIATMNVGAGASADAKQNAAEALQGFFLMFTREGESTADYGAVRAVGPDGPRFMAMTFDIVSRTPRAGSLTALKDSWTRNHKVLNEEKLEYSEEDGKLSHAQYASQTTHPTRMLRAIGNYDHAKEASTRLVWAFENKPARFRLMGAAQAVDSEIERLEDEHAEFQHGTPDHQAPEQMMKTLEDQHTRRAIRREYDRMRVITSELAKLVFEDGLHAGAETIPYGKHVFGFMKSGGEKLFRHEGATNPLAALLGGGEGETPQCVKMAGQLAEELERIVDNAKISETEKAEWGELIDAYRALADESGAKSARIGRTKQKAAVRSFAKLS